MAMLHLMGVPIAESFQYQTTLTEPQKWFLLEALPEAKARLDGNHKEFLEQRKKQEGGKGRYGRDEKPSITRRQEHIPGTPVEDGWGESGTMKDIIRARRSGA